VGIEVEAESFRVLLLIGFALILDKQALLFFFRSSIPDFSYGVVFAMGLVFGVVDAIFNTQMPAMIGAYFPVSCSYFTPNLKQ
jgi:hypothetical protein